MSSLNDLTLLTVIEVLKPLARETKGRVVANALRARDAKEESLAVIREIPTQAAVMVDGLRRGDPRRHPPGHPADAGDIVRTAER